MGIAERKEREKLKRSNDILDAAEKVFFERGFVRATMDEVAARAELSKGTIYLYFKSKELLYLGISIRASSMLHDIFQKAVRTGSTGMEQLLAIGRAYRDFSCEHPNYFHTISHFDNLDDKAIAALSEEPIAQQAQESGMATLGVLVDAIRLGVSDGTIRADIDPCKTAFLIWGFSNGVIQIIKNRGEHCSRDFDFNPQELYGIMLEFNIRALSPVDKERPGKSTKK